MEFRGRYLIPAPADVVWKALNDPETLSQCVPGCESMEKIDETQFNAVATLKIGPVKATFKATIRLSDLDPPHRCTLRGEGQGGVAGFARGEAQVVLEPEAGGTALSYTANATIGGKLAQIGQRLIDGAAKQIADDFFTRFVALVAASPAPQQTADAPAAAVEEPAQAAGTATAASTAEKTNRPGLAPEIWVIGLLAVIAILLVLFGLVLQR